MVMNILMFKFLKMRHEHGGFLNGWQKAFLEFNLLLIYSQMQF